MALITCPECGKEISDQAKACPHCGFPLLPQSEIRDIDEEGQEPAMPQRICPKCGGVMAIQTTVEQKHDGCFMVLVYILLAITIFGLLIVIPLLMRDKSITVTRAVCQNCGYTEWIE